MNTVSRAAEQRLPDQPEIVGGVLDAVELMRAIDAPAVLARLNDRCRRGRGCARRAFAPVRIMQLASVAAHG